MTYSRSDEKKNRNAPAWYTLRAFRREKSDEPGTMPREKRHTRRRQRRRNGRRKSLGRDAGQSPGQHGGNEKRKLILKTGGDRRCSSRLRIRRRGRDAAIRLVATTAGPRRAPGTGRQSLARGDRLRPHEQQDEEDGGQLFHVCSCRNETGGAIISWPWQLRLP